MVAFIYRDIYYFDRCLDFFCLKYIKINFFVDLDKAISLDDLLNKLRLFLQIGS